MVRYFLASVLALVGCSAGHEGQASHDSRPSHDSRDALAIPSASIAAQAQSYLGHAVITGGRDRAACPLAWDLEQYRNDMRNMRVGPDSPGYAVASAYDLHNRRCIELERGERVDIMGDSSLAETLVRPLGQSQTYWTSANWIRPEALAEPIRRAKESTSPQERPPKNDEQQLSRPSASHPRTELGNTPNHGSWDEGGVH